MKNTSKKRETVSSEPKKSDERRTPIEQTRELADEMIEVAELLTLLEWAVTARLAEDEVEREAFLTPVDRARKVLRKIYNLPEFTR